MNLTEAYALVLEDIGDMCQVIDGTAYNLMAAAERLVEPMAPGWGKWIPKLERVAPENRVRYQSLCADCAQQEAAAQTWGDVYNLIRERALMHGLDLSEDQYKSKGFETWEAYAASLGGDYPAN